MKIFAPKTVIQALNPADHFTLAMDEEIRKDGMPGSLCGFALELEGSPNIDQLNERILCFCQNFPTSLATLRQIGRRFYWCSRETPNQVFFTHQCSGEQDENHEFHQGIGQIMNRKKPRDSDNPVEFHLFQGSAKSVLLIRWLHPFCDAVGASLILKYLAEKNPPPKKSYNDRPASLVNQQLNKFNLWNKFRLLLKGKKLIEQNDLLESILPVDSSASPARLNFSVFQLSESQTRKIAESSQKHVGITGTSQYYIACMMRAIDRMKTQSSGDAYCIPYAFNLRRQKATNPVTGNHVSALFAQAPLEIVQCRSRLFQHLKDQYRRAIRHQLDFAFLPLMWAAQWMSLGKYGKTLRKSYRTGNERSSFWFSDIGQSDLSGQKIFGARITGLFHVCQMTTPPGLGLLTCVFQDRLSLTYNFVEPLFNSDWVTRLHQYLLIELLGDMECPE